MMPNPNIVFYADPRHGLVARSGWEQEEARAVLRELGWEWQEELHALVPPADTPDADAGVQAVEQLHLHGHLAGYAVGRFGAMRLTLDRAEQVLTRAVAQQGSGPQQDVTPCAGSRGAEKSRSTAYRGATDPVYTASPETPDPPPL
ncbi:hypothetical protein GCM10009665_06390 [Kitasatospora nipponensis]|uniref:Uncharacterized protein n=1 Tax=Kitasatospora nipponensis TaxID=258049 RepID=A0ABN1VQC6_9ACTN